MPNPFDIPGVTIGLGDGRLERVLIDNEHATAEIYLHGAHVTRFQPKSQTHPVLWMSGKSHFTAGRAIRGGIPICFPWFGPKADDPKAPAHGFARTSLWTLSNVECAGDDVRITLQFRSDEHTRAKWPHEFEATYIVTVGKTLRTELVVKNTDRSPFTYEAALHSYFTVGDISRVLIRGLEGATYLDRLQPGERFVQPNAPISFAGETDQTYVNTTSAITIEDGGLERSIRVEKSGSNSTVVWNPWVAKSKAMPDFGDDEWTGMVCIETANAGENAVTLAPGASHAIRSTVSV